jgi:major membrane immunogen (membrane-anchored lipoprotein)
VKTRVLFLCGAVVLILISALFYFAYPDETIHDGYYTAEAKHFDEHGWKEIVTIFVSGGKITTVEYNARNSSGFIKSWDMDYMRVMNASDGTYPNAYTRIYAADLLAKQDVEKIDAISGATHSYHTFQQLAAAVMEKIKEGDTSVAFVDFPHNE